VCVCVCDLAVCVCVTTPLHLDVTAGHAGGGVRVLLDASIIRVVCARCGTLGRTYPRDTTPCRMTGVTLHRVG